MRSRPKINPALKQSSNLADFLSVLLAVIVSAAGATGLVSLFNNVTGQTEEVAYYYEFLSFALASGSLSIYLILCIHRGLALFWRIATIYFSIGFFNIQVEALLFNITSLTQSLELLFLALFLTTIPCLILMQLIDVKRPSLDFTRIRGERPSLLKIILGSILYFLFYAVAGLLLSYLSPDIREFYRDKLPAVNMILLTNVIVRGLVFVLIANLIDQSTAGSKRVKSLTTGMLFAIIGGIAPLIPPNELMPDYVRLGHAIEVGVSNFIYGMLVLHLLHWKGFKTTRRIGVDQFLKGYKLLLTCLLIIGILGMPGEYYFFLKIILFPSCLFLGIKVLKNKQVIAAISLFTAAIIFNPFFPISMAKVYWQTIDISLAVLLLFIKLPPATHNHRG